MSYNLDIGDQGVGDEDEEEENAFWWRQGLIQAPRAVVHWDHVDEDRPSKGIPEKGRKVTWSELFLDLVLVTNISLLGEAYQDGPLTLLQVIVLYRVIYECWWSTTQYAAKFYVDDLVDKYVTGLEMFLLVCAGLRIGDWGFAQASKVVARAAGVYHLVMSLGWYRAIRAHRGSRAHLVGHGLAPSIVFSIGFLASSFLPYPLITLIFMTVLEPVWHLTGYNCFRQPKRERIPIHVEHMVERRGCLRLILFGEVITGVTGTGIAAGSSKHIYAALPAIAAGFIVVLNMKLLAFDVDVVPTKRHTYRIGGFVRPVVYLEASFFFDVCMGVMGSCIKLLLAGFERGRLAHAHELMCFCVAGGVICLTVERLMHDQSHIIGDHWWNSWGRKTSADLMLSRRAAVANASTYKAVAVDEPPLDVDTAQLDQCAKFYRLQKKIFLLQIYGHVVIVFCCFALALFCRSIDHPVEVTLVLGSLAFLTTVAVIINLLDELEIVIGCKPPGEN